MRSKSDLHSPRFVLFAKEVIYFCIKEINFNTALTEKNAITVKGEFKSTARKLEFTEGQNVASTYVSAQAVGKRQWYYFFQISQRKSNVNDFEFFSWV